MPLARDSPGRLGVGELDAPPARDSRLSVGDLDMPLARDGRMRVGELDASPARDGHGRQLGAVLMKSARLRRRRPCTLVCELLSPLCLLLLLVVGFDFADKVYVKPGMYARIDWDIPRDFLRKIPLRCPRASRARTVRR